MDVQVGVSIHGLVDCYALPYVEAARPWWMGLGHSMAYFMTGGVPVLMSANWLLGLGHETWEVLGLVLAHW